MYLKVLGRRPDGYHELITVMQPLSLADELVLAPAPGGLSLRCGQPGVPAGKSNLVWRAAEAFFKEAGRHAGVDIALTKRTPVAAGLGGGSSDAAGTLLALNELMGEPLEPEALQRLGSSLGADVPFFLKPGPKVGRGTGTELSPLDLPPYWYLLVNPGVRLSTRWVYENLDLDYLSAHGAPLRDAWEGGEPAGWVANDLETVTLKRYPKLMGLLQELARLGAAARGMSGSGPTLFGIFATSEGALDAARTLRRTFPGWLAVARGLTGAEPDAGWEEQVWMV